MRLRDLAAILSMPRGEQHAALAHLRAGIGKPEQDEAWNQLFGDDSLYGAWTRTTVSRGVLDHNAARVREALDGRTGWCALEIGGGDGSLWQKVLRPGSAGRLVLVDPVAEVHEVVARALPPSVELVSIHDRVERVLDRELPPVDIAVVSLALHHVPGEDAEQCERVGLGARPAKGEVLRWLSTALERADGRLLLSEADIYCDVDLAPGDPVLADRLLDSYVRRCGLSIIHDLQRGAPNEGLARRWRAILRHWCVEQVDMANVPLADRDVYELDVARWLRLLERSGLVVERHGFTDAYQLFHSYECRPRG